MAISFPSVTLQGNVLTFDSLGKIAAGKAAADMPRQAARDYGFPNEEALSREIQRNWADALDQYGIFKRQLERLEDGESGTSETRSRWMLPFLSLFGYEMRSLKKAQEIDGRRYAISHEVSNEERNFPVHIVGARQSLNSSLKVGKGQSPHGLIQEYLNRHENLYALVTNGLFLRLLRDSSNLTKLSYVEFDLTRIFEEKLFSDFSLLFRLLHLSRLPASPADGDESVLEKYHQAGLKSGSRIREKLSEAVELGIEALGTGLLRDARNDALRQWAAENPNAAKDYYDALLKLIYRLLFIMVIEERDLIFPKADQGADAGAGQVEKSKDETRAQLASASHLSSVEGPGVRFRRIYYDYYALARLRRLATTYQLAGDRKYDLWDSLMNTFALFEDRGIGLKLGIEPLAGSLFSQEALGPLRGCRVNNQVLLMSLRGLSQFDNDQGGVEIVNYASLDVEEFGSVYEGLLDYDPEIVNATQTFRFVPGQDRSDSGSHYTPDELVQPLLKHSLDHLIAARTVSPTANEAQRTEARRQLLALNVADVACGSGHILLAAARRIGLELARLENRVEQPSPPDLRRGVRDAIRYCIYGTDKNPLAVELCKVALWLEAHVPGEPLNFLDHRIRHGDAVVGVGRLEDLENGIAEAAFKNYPGDSDQVKANGRALRKRNKAERALRSKGSTQIGMFSPLGTVEDQLAAFRNKYLAFADLPERTPAEIDAKAAAYREITGGTTWWFLKTLADVQTAQFFLPLDQPDRLTSDGRFFEMLRGEHRQSTAAAAATGESTNRHFFHWFLEFPEVFAQGGFDCVVGNPPFKGGKKISTVFGNRFLQYVYSKYNAKGATDLVAYFYLRIFDILSDGGFQSLIATDSLAQGDTRQYGLGQILTKGASIVFAVRSMKWPGDSANTQICSVSIAKFPWEGKVFLEGEVVKNVNSHLYDQEPLRDPYKLKSNDNCIYEGSKIYGQGFILKEDKVEKWTSSSFNEKEVIFKYLGGEDVNENVAQQASRWVVNFHGWPLRRLSVKEYEELDDKSRTRIDNKFIKRQFSSVAPPNYGNHVAEDYPEALEYIVSTVKDERQRLKTNSNGIELDGQYALRKPLPERWWIYGDRRPGLYNDLKGTDRTIVIPIVSKHTPIVEVNSNQVFSHKVCVIPKAGMEELELLSSNIHKVWAWRYSTKQGASSLTYTSTRAYDTFPKPYSTIKISNYSSVRDDTHRMLRLGLTEVYNQFHNLHLETDYDDFWQNDVLPNPKKLKARKQCKETYNLWRHLDMTDGTIGMGEAVARIVELRQLHQQMDEAVLAAYGWDVDTRRWGPAIKLGHDFHEVDYLPEKDNIRYTIAPEARRKVLKRLLLLNHEIHEAEERGVDYAVIDGERIEALLMEQLQAWCPKAEKLHWKTRRFLCTGEDLLPGLARSLNKSYKPFVTQYASGLEAELQEKLFITWNQEFQRRFPLDDGSLKTYLEEQKALDPEKQRLNKFAGMLLKSNVKYTLGDMHFILNMVYKPTGSTIKKSTLLQDFRAYAVSVYGEAVLDKVFLARVGDFVKSFRNDAAHTGVVDKAMAEACRDEVRELVMVLVENEKG